MSRNIPKRPRSFRIAFLALGALVLVGGAFAFASGPILDEGNSLLASAAAAITGRPTILIGRDGASPAGNIPMGNNDTLAIFDIAVKRVTHWATVRYVSVYATISAEPSSPLSLSNIALTYQYCIPKGVTYGYGYTGGGCNSMRISPSSVSKEGSNYVLGFSGAIPIYPQQIYGAFSISAVPTYAYTGRTQHANVGNARLQVKITGATASGDQCKWTWNSASYGYGYTGCVAYNAIVNFQAPYGNRLTVIRPYGYGYAIK